MGEFKRVFLDKSRLIAFSLLTVFCILILGYTLIGSIGPGAVKNSISAKEYAVSLIDECRDMSAEEISQALLLESERLANINSWVSGSRSDWYGFQSEAEYEAAISYYPYLKSLSGNYEDFNRAYNAYTRWLGMVKEEAVYQAGYKDYLTGIAEQAEKFSLISIFGKADSFSNKNIIKTAEDFSTLDGVETVFGNNLGLELWLNFKVADYLFVGGILIIVLAFFEERKNGLWSVIRSTSNGRINLGISRLLILSAGSALCTILFCLLPLIISLGFTEGWDLGRALQSLQSFRTSTLAITISDWLVRYFIIKTLSGIAIGLVIWCVLGSVVNPQFSLSVLGVILVLEYALYELLPVQSFANIFKYFNFFSYIHLSSLYTDYLNINLFGSPIGIRVMMLFTLTLLILITAVWALLIQARRYPQGNKDILGRVSIGINRFIDIFRTSFTMGGWELYKAFIFGFGAVILVGIVILGGSLKYKVYIHEPDAWYQAYLIDAEGEITEETDEYFALARENAGNDGELMASLMKLEAQVSEAKEKANAGGYETWLVDEKVYNSYYGERSSDRQRLNALIAIAFVVFLSAGIGAYEKQSGVTFMVRSTKNGRSGLIARKAVTSAAMAVIVWANVYLREFIVFLNSEKPVTLGAAVQNLSSLASFPLRITLGQYLVILYGIRLIMLILTSLIVLAVGSLCKNILMSYIINISALVFPGLLVVLGVEAMKYLSPIISVSSAEILWNAGENPTGWIYYAIAVAEAIVAGAIGYIGNKID